MFLFSKLSRGKFNNDSVIFFISIFGFLLLVKTLSDFWSPKCY